MVSAPIGSGADQALASGSAYRPLFEDNIDAAVIDFGHGTLDRYKLAILPSAYVMDEPTAAAVRKYVANGGTVIMTGYSAKVDETGKWFETPLPGRLSDVFGLRTNAFYRAEQPLKVTFEGQTLTASAPYYEVLELVTAKPLARFANAPQGGAAITVNHFGKGQAIYLATAPQAELLGPLLRSLYPALGIRPGPKTPAGVIAREVDGRTLYVNTTQAPVTVTIAGQKRGVLSRKSYTGTIALAPMAWK